MRIDNPTGFTSNLTGSFTGSFFGDGSGLTGTDSGSWDGDFTGSAEITGSLRITGSLDTTGAAVFGGNVEIDTSGGDGALGGTLRLSSTNTNVSARNWALINTWDNYGDLTFRVGNAQGDNPLTSGSTKMVITSGGAATFSSASAKSLTGSFNVSINDLTSFAQGVGGGITLGGYKSATAQEFFAAIDGYKENGTSVNAAGAFRVLTQPSDGSGLVERMRISSGGNVTFIGTAPNSEDEITQLNFYNTSSSLNLARITAIRQAGGSNYGALSFSTTNAGTISEKMRISSNGQVGVKYPPVAVGDLNGGGDVSSTFFPFQVGGNETDGRAFLGSVYQNPILGGASINSAGNYINMGYMKVSSEVATAGAEEGSLKFFTKPSNTSSSLRLTISSGGNVGIGTDSPDLGSVSGTRVLTIASPDAERWGILELAGNRTWGGNQVGELKFISTDATNNGTLVSLTAVNDTSATGTGGDLKFNTRANGGSLTERMRIRSSGSVFMGHQSVAGIATGLQLMNPINAAGTGHGTSILLHCTDGDPNRGVKIASSSTANFAIDNDMVFYTSAGSTLSEKMRITSGGEVQTPQNPAFRANAQSGWAAASGWQKVIYDANVTTRGTGYANSRFTAPVDGWYQFNAQWTATSNSDTDGTFSLWINGSSSDLVGSVSIPNTGGLYSGHVVSGCCYLAATSYVEVYRYSSVSTTTRSSAPYGGWFSGFLIG